ncbi:MAG: hypothetical protein JXA23_01035 [Bacteroidales bacterium]|nr:hypothetical protein [Bacteroidales bacterium]
MRIRYAPGLMVLFGITVSAFQLNSDNPVLKKQSVAISNKCLTCHAGIEEIKDPGSSMMDGIREVASDAGYEENTCIVCHGGNPEATDNTTAHKGTLSYFQENDGPKDFYPDPGSPWINLNTCGYCHEAQTRPQFTSLMFTEAGKIQGTGWGFGGLNGYNHNQANYDVDELPVDNQQGSKIYLQYMKKLKAAEPQIFPGMMKQLPPAPTPEEIAKDPQLAAYTYIRQECQRCHTGNQGRKSPGDYRGMGCSACHIPYSTEGYYEGKDSSISRKEPGHVLVHSLQATRECAVTIHDKTYSGIPVRTCVTCHNRGRRIGTSFMGLLETAYKSPFMPDGNVQEQVFTKNYIHLHADIHKDNGMLCQDCHTSLDIHSSGVLAGTTLAPIEIECQDCHGTPQKFPWELPIGFGDEVTGDLPATGEARGVADEIAEYSAEGTLFDAEEGYLLSARGNPLPHVVKKGDVVIIHTAGGKDIVLFPLKTLLQKKKLSSEGIVAMDNVKGHIDRMECYACHDNWAPQCYGCHLKVDYSKNEFRTDWTANGNDHAPNGLTADARGESNHHLIPGRVEEQQSYILFENPPLAVNGEHRVSVSVPGCQTTVSIIGKDKKPLLLNHIFRIPNVEGAGPEGQLASDMAILHPHTVSKQARSCESCHDDPKALGYGIEQGSLMADPSKPYNIDLTSADGTLLPDNSKAQINSIPNLDHDWSRFVSEEGTQLQTVGHHFTGERPLNQDERMRISREGVCSSCHQSIPDKDPAISLLSHVREVAAIPVSNAMHLSLLHRAIIVTAWIEVIAPVLIVSVILFLFLRKRYLRKKHL